MCCSNTLMVMTVIQFTSIIKHHSGQSSSPCQSPPSVHAPHSPYSPSITQCLLQGCRQVCESGCVWGGGEEFSPCPEERIKERDIKSKIISAVHTPSLKPNIQPSARELQQLGWPGQLHYLYCSHPLFLALICTQHHYTLPTNVAGNLDHLTLAF